MIFFQVILVCLAAQIAWAFLSAVWESWFSPSKEPILREEPEYNPAIMFPKEHAKDVRAKTKCIRKNFGY